MEKNRRNVTLFYYYIPSPLLQHYISTTFRTLAACKLPVMTMDLLSEFKRGTEEQWLDKISIDLKGKPIESLVWESEIGQVNPVIFSSEEITSDIFLQKETNSWNIRQNFDANHPDVNKQILTALRGGVNAIEVKNLTSGNINEALNDVMLEVINIYIDINTSQPLTIIDAFSEYCTSKNLEIKTLEGGFIYDPIGNVALTGNWYNDENSDLAKIEEIILAADKFEKFSILNINALTYCNAGANVDSQIAFAIAHGNEYLNLFKSNQNLLEKIIQKTEFTIGIGTSYFLEIAKLRSFRSLWSNIVSQYSSGLIIETKIHAVNANLCYSNKDIYNNLLRATTSGMSAVIGGCDSLSLLPFNYNAVDNDEFGQRISKNIQLVLQEEGYLNKVKDTSKGSYYIEELILKIKESSWSTFLSTEKEGGFTEALKKGIIQNQIKKEIQLKESDLKEDKRIMIGVNKFVNESEETTKMVQPTIPSTSTTIKPITPKRLPYSYEKIF